MSSYKRQIRFYCGLLDGRLWCIRGTKWEMMGRPRTRDKKGRRRKLEVVPFGELVMYTKLAETAQERKSLESIWYEGVWLGHAIGSSEPLLGTKDGVVRA